MRDFAALLFRSMRSDIAVIAPAAADPLTLWRDHIRAPRAEVLRVLLDGLGDHIIKIELTFRDQILGVEWNSTEGLPGGPLPRSVNAMMSASLVKQQKILEVIRGRTTTVGSFQTGLHFRST
jgi:hypothetical protein